MVRSERPSNHVIRVDGARTLSQKEIYPYETSDIVALGEHASMTERRADEATRDVESWLKCEYLQDQVGQVFDGVVAAATGFGLFVEIKDLYVEGLVHITALPQDYYRFEPAQHRLVGDRTRKVFGLGDELRVRVVRVDLDSRKIDFEMEEVTATRRGKGKANARPPRADQAAAKTGKGGKSARGGSSKAKAKAKPRQDNKPAQGKKSQPGEAGGGSKSRGSGNRRPRKASSAKASGDYGQKQNQRSAQPQKAGATQSPEAPASTQARSLFASAAAGVKKALAKFKKKR
mgnify:CR=1 FL=1